MFYPCIVWLVILAYILCDVNYFVRTFFTVLSARLLNRKCDLDEITVIYGMCTFQDCDITFTNIRLSRIIRELDFARYHFYDRTGIYARSRVLNIRSLQGSTLVHHWTLMPLFTPYKITTKLVYWDDRSLFFEHEIISLRDGHSFGLLVSRQFALTQSGGYATESLLGSRAFKGRLDLPEYIRTWLESMEVSSVKLRGLLST